MTVTAPCKNCKDRSAGCHSTCMDYLVYQIRHEEETEAVQEKKDKERMKRDYIKHVIERNKR